MIELQGSGAEVEGWLAGLTGGLDGGLKAGAEGRGGDGRAIGRGAIGLRRVAGVDAGVVARWGGTGAECGLETAWVMPHAGPAVLAAVAERLTAMGVARRGDDQSAAGVRATYPEAESLVEARMLSALARTESRLAVDWLLDQPRRWGEAAAGRLGVTGAAESAVLRRLVDPPLVAAVGPPNVGKSSLLNALAGRVVAVAAEGAGTTRDYVAATLDLGGVSVRYIDTPGIGRGGGVGAAEVDRAAARAAMREVEGADLVLWCGDPLSGFLAEGAAACKNGAGRVRVMLRDDLEGPHRREGADVRVSLRGGKGVSEEAAAGVVAAVREALVPAALLADERAWGELGE